MNRSKLVYTKEQFGRDLKQRVSKRDNVESIGYWAHSMYLDWPDCKDIDF